MPTVSEPHPVKAHLSTVIHINRGLFQQQHPSSSNPLHPSLQCPFAPVMQTNLHATCHTCVFLRCADCSLVRPLSADLGGRHP